MKLGRSVISVVAIPFWSSRCKRPFTLAWRSRRTNLRPQAECDGKLVASKPAYGSTAESGATTLDNEVYSRTAWWLMRQGTRTKLGEVTLISSNPATDPACIRTERGAELSAHFRFLEWDMHPIHRRKHQHWYCEHWQRPHPEGNTEREDEKPQINRIAREAIRSANDQRLVRFRSRIEFRALEPKQRNCPESNGKPNSNQSNAQPNDA